MKKHGNQKRGQKGFTLIELMVAVAIVGILVATAIPAYQNYMRNANFAEVNSVADGYKLAVSMCLQMTGGTAGCTAGANGVPLIPAPLPQNIAAMAVNNGTISITGAANTGSLTYISTPNINGGVVSWTQTGTCEGAGVCATDGV